MWSDCLAVTGRRGRCRYCDWDDRATRRLPPQLRETPVGVQYPSDLKLVVQLVSELLVRGEGTY